ncbi:PQQ-binding-like beta-propeller repeat protein [Gimesia maris]|uniref:PQQ-binding-like beta-propeller repeat protein n=1 Tax=Gimesia maris TaxID=122 RepID=UPI00241C37B0|nr:PQQ-binding-like beta-propeller repeat protein [Gimesia maris]|tara:strand:- start:108778 stop:113457 length:4680 start_codon:yes stop_codon:yes gene_type:complete
MNRLFPPFSGFQFPKNVSTRILLCLGVVLFYPCFYLLSGEKQNKQPLLAFLDPPEQKEVPDQSEPDQSVSEEREALIHRIYRNRNLQTQFDRAEQKFQNREFTEGALQLEKLLDHQEDYFFWSDDQPRPVNFRERTRQLYSQFSPRSLADYERISGPQANQLLQQARQTNDLRLYELLALRFFPLRAGFEALNYLATHYMEQGNFDFAARYWDLLLESRLQQSRLEPVHLLKAALTYQQSHQHEKTTQILEVYGTAEVIVSGKTLPLEQALQILDTSLTGASSQQRIDWPVSQGNAKRNQSVDASLPYLNPVWSHPIGLTDKDRPLETLRNWETKQFRENLSTAVTNQPIAVDDLVIYRDFKGIRAVNLDSGKTAWLFQSAGSLSQLIDQLEEHTPSHSTYSQNLPLEKFYNYNSIYGSLSSNGQSVFAIDYLPDTLPPAQVNMGLRKATSHFSLVSQKGNRLVALPLNRKPAADRQKTGVPASPAGGSETAELQTKPTWTIEGYYFLGAPLPVGNYIYAIAEHHSQLSILCINPQNGAIHWKQGIAFVNQPIFTDRTRAYMHCPLTSSQGVLVCTTQMDTLVAIDATNGDLLWNYYYGDGEQYRRISQKRYYRPLAFGHPGLSSAPLIDQHRVFYLPTGSPYIHCVDLNTGLPLWEEVHREDAEYVAAVVDETVLIVGSDYCRGRHIEDGRELWHLHVGPVTGKGFLSHKNYLLPIKTGSVLSIDIPTGKESGFTLSNTTQITEILNRDFKQKLRQGAAYAYQGSAQKSNHDQSRHSWYPGNIIAHQDKVISLGLWQIDAFPQAEAMLTSLPQIDHQSLNSPQNQGNQLLKAELELALGNLNSAQHRLETLLSIPTAANVKSRSESLLRELLYAELNQSTQDEFQILAKLERLATTPQERGRYLSRKSRYLLEQENYQALMDVAEEFKNIDVIQPLAMAGDTDHLVTTKSLIAGLMEKVTAKADRVEREALDAKITDDQQAALKDGSIPALQAFLDTYGSWSQAVAVRSRLAARLTEQGQIQQAEFLLMLNRSHPDGQIAANATCELLELWQAAGLPHEAAALLSELDNKYAQVILDTDITGKQYVNRFDRSSQTWNIFQAMQPLKHEVSHLIIRQSDLGTPSPEIRNTYKNYERKFLPPPEISQLLLKAGGQLHVINKHAGLTIGKIEVSDRISYPYHSQNTRVGHFIPLGSSRKIHGVSLLQLNEDISSPLWTKEFDDLNNSQSLFYVGPSGPRVCVFQWDNRLFGLNPATGKVLWERRNIPSKSGFLSDSSKGLIGDQQALVAFNINRTNYDVYSTITGELIRKGELDLNSRSRHVFGRKLFYETTSTTEKRVRLWDPLTDQHLLDEPVSNTSLSAQISETELAVLLPPNRLRVLNVETGETIIESVIPDEYLKSLNKFIGFKDQERYYFNFSYTSPRRRSPQNDFYVSDSFLNVVHVDNDLISIDGKTGQILWSRNLPKRSWVDTSQYQLPFLIFMSKIRTESRTRSYSFLLEILDASTGDTIGFKDNILKDTILQLQIDPRFHKIILQGLHSAIEIDFSDKAKSLDSIFEKPL